MAQFIQLLKESKDLKQLVLFEVIENNRHMWLVQYINKKLTAKWFYSYNVAYDYYIKCHKRHFKTK